jgi:hypothetical protein
MIKVIGIKVTDRIKEVGITQEVLALKKVHIRKIIF